MNGGNISKVPTGSAFRSLDKRFDITHFFIAPVLFAGISPLVVERKQVILYVLSDLTKRATFPALLRGPPSRVS